jgi:hypothetical protein
MLLLLVTVKIGSAAQTNPPASPVEKSFCRVEPVDYKGWKAQQISNPWVQLIVVPQNGGRLMQVRFNGHDYLFVNPKLQGKHSPPDQDHWFNYGGDKIWLLPEGNDDEQHWRGNSDLIDSGEFSFQKLSDGAGCGIELTGPADPHTGVQISRVIRLGPDSPRITFRASMKNISGHPLEWSQQSVSQYDTGDPANPSRGNREIWGFTPANRSSAYLNRYHVRTGPAENPSASINEDGFFAVHYSHVASEFWIDSPEGWLAVVDAKNRYAMVERFEYQPDKTYPGKASIIFWTNGNGLRFDADGNASISGGSDDSSPFYMEAEINSPMCRLKPGESCQLETDWFPTRSDGQFRGVTDAGIISRPLQAVRLKDGEIKLTGSFGVFFPGKLVANFYTDRGSRIAGVPVANVSPAEFLVLDSQTSPQGTPARVSLHLEDQNGVDRGALQEVLIKNQETQ